MLQVIIRKFDCDPMLYFVDFNHSDHSDLRASAARTVLGQALTDSTASTGC